MTTDEFVARLKPQRPESTASALREFCEQAQGRKPIPTARERHRTERKALLRELREHLALKARGGRTVDLLESVSQGGSLAVAGREPVVKGVKVLGYDSVNRRRYTPEAAQAAAGLYEGAKVNFDHPEGNPGASRAVRDRFGRLENVTVKEDGLYADLRYNPEHPLAGSFRWWAENDPGAIGLSHNAVGQGRTEDGIFVVERIVTVRSVDLVGDPATTRGLFESRGPGPGRGMSTDAFARRVNKKRK